jgi:hypothetical protein
VTPEDAAASPPPVPRPRPQFGELATPEEQRAAIAVPVDRAAAEPVPIEAEGARRRHEASGSGRPAPSPGPATGRQPADRFASWALLGVGLFNILTTTPALLDLPGAIDQFFDSAGLDPYGPVAAARILGIGALVVNIALWVLVLVLVQRRVASGRTSWWIPLVAGVVANLVVLVCVGSAMTIDPAVFEYIRQMSGAS